MRSLTKHLENNPITTVVPTDNRHLLNKYRAKYGMGKVSKRINMLKANGKLALDTGSGVKAFGLSLNPASTHGEWNTCLWSTAGCEAACILDFAYQQAENVRNSRRALVDYIADDLQGFINHVAFEIAELNSNHPETIAIRLNTASDLRWERFAGALFDYFSDVMFYDYTKAPMSQRDLRDDYTLVYSVSERERSVENAREYLAAGHSATIVLPIRYRSHSDHDDIPAELDGIAVDHDQHDVRALDRGKLGVLRAKGSARSDTSGFVRDIAEAKEIVNA